MDKMEAKGGFSNIRELSFGETRIVASEESCSDQCYQWPGCDCQPPGSPDSGRAGYNLGLALERWLTIIM